MARLGDDVSQWARGCASYGTREEDVAGVTERVSQLAASGAASTAVEELGRELRQLRERLLSGEQRREAERPQLEHVESVLAEVQPLRAEFLGIEVPGWAMWGKAAATPGLEGPAEERTAQS